MSQYTQKVFDFAKLGRREVVGRFDGGHISSVAGVMLLAMADSITGMCRQLAACFEDRRDPDRVEHPLDQLLKQRIFALVLGYDDLNDREELRCDPLLAAAVGCVELLGENRHRVASQGVPLAGKSTLNRLELAEDGDRLDTQKSSSIVTPIESLFVDLFLQAYDTPPDRIILDLDATDVTLHGDPTERFYHGYYGD